MLHNVLLPTDYWNTELSKISRTAEQNDKVHLKRSTKFLFLNHDPFTVDGVIKSQSFSTDPFTPGYRDPSKAPTGKIWGSFGMKPHFNTWLHANFGQN